MLKEQEAVCHKHICDRKSDYIIWKVGVKEANKAQIKWGQEQSLVERHVLLDFGTEIVKLRLNRSAFTWCLLFSLAPKAEYQKQLCNLLHLCILCAFYFLKP